MSSDPNQVGPNEAIQKPGWQNPGFSWQQNNGATRSFAQNPGSVQAPAAVQSVSSGLANVGNAATGGTSGATPYKPGQIAATPMTIGQYTDGGMALKMGAYGNAFGFNGTGAPQGTENAGYTHQLAPIVNPSTPAAMPSQLTVTPQNGIVNSEAHLNPAAVPTMQGHYLEPSNLHPTAHASVTQQNGYLNPNDVHPTAHSTITPQNGNYTGMPAHLPTAPRYTPGRLAPMNTAPTAQPYRANSQYNGVQGTVSNGIGRAGDSLKHLFGGTLGQHEDNRRTKFYQSPTNATVPNRGR